MKYHKHHIPTHLNTNKYNMNTAKYNVPYKLLTLSQ